MRAPVAEPAPAFYSPAALGLEIYSMSERSDLSAGDDERTKRFLAIASHDLQSPLRHIAMYAEILLDDLGDAAIDSEHRQYLRTILDKAQTAQRLTKALMSFAAGTPQVRLADVDTDALVRQIWAELLAEVDAPGATLDVRPLPTVKTDAAILRIVLKIILGNALVHRLDTAPRVTIAAAAGASELTIHVTDDGPGIDQDHHGSIFDAFWSLPQAGAEKRPGLGLTAARDLLAALGGGIRLDSSNENGSRFAISLPAG
jgi:light-regulated signal transduction histidine kinase (bacteriophytochrome)